MEKLLKLVGTIVVLAILVVAGSSFYVEQTTQEHVYSDVGQLPAHQTALILKTERYLHENGSDPFMKERISGVARVYRNGPVQTVVVSGDSVAASQMSDPKQIKARLVKQGVRERDIVLGDDGDIDTFKRVFRATNNGEQSVIVVSQAFHAKRVVSLARGLGTDSVGYRVSEPFDRSWRAWIGEHVRRARGLKDLYWYKWIEKPSWFQYSESDEK